MHLEMHWRVAFAIEGYVEMQCVFPYADRKYFYFNNDKIKRKNILVQWMGRWMRTDGARFEYTTNCSLLSKLIKISKHFYALTPSFN